MSKIKHLIHKITSNIKLTTPVSIIIGAIIIAVGLMGYGFITTGNSNPTTKSSLFVGRPIDKTDYVEGNKNSKIVVVEYSDPECPFCIMFHPTMKQILSEYKDKVAFVYRHFPLTGLHPLAFDMSRAIACAGKVGGETGYYNYISTYYDIRVDSWQKSKAQQPPALPATGREDIAKTVGLDINAFNACMKNNDTKTDVENSIKDGSTQDASGAPIVNGTPSTYILMKTRKGYEVVSKVEGARPYDFVKAAIDQALTK